MQNSQFSPVRRRLLQGMALGAGSLLFRPGVLAEELATTASLTEGPFYPDRLPLDTDNDLLIVNDSLTPAAGEITHLSGRILTAAGSPIRNAFVEIWQVDAHGHYLHSADRNQADKDANFQGYGRFLTDSKGHYYFRTIKPVPYPGRTPHIHLAVSQNGRRVLTTQLLIRDHPLNARDGVLRAIRDPKVLETVMLDFRPVEDSKLGELSAQCDVVLGRTFDERPIEEVKGGVGRPEWGQRGPAGNPPRGNPPRSNPPRP